MSPDIYAIATLVAAPFVGSFSSVLVVRLPGNEQVVFGRSRCDRCKHALRSFDLIPLASFVWLGGRCRYCREAISRVHIALEAGAIGVALWASIVFSGPAIAISALLGWCLLALAAMDIRSFFLSDALTLPLIAAGLAVNILYFEQDAISHVAGGALGFGLMAGVAQGYRVFRGVEGLGMGDSKLLAAAGSWVGWQGLGSVLLIATAVMFLLVLIEWRRTQELKADKPYPLGLGLCCGLWLTWCYGALIVVW